MNDEISRIVRDTVEENEKIRRITRNTIRRMILDGDIRIKEVERDLYSNEGFNYGPETLYVLSIDGDEQDPVYGLSIDSPEITGW